MNKTIKLSLNIVSKKIYIPKKVSPIPIYESKIYETSIIKK
jgi:hypothetical protein